MKIIIEQELQNLLQPLSQEERETLKQSIQDDGQREPILLWNRSQGEGVIVDGHQRYAILKELGIVPKARVVTTITTLDQAKLYMLVLQLGRRNITPDVRKALAADLYEVRARIARMDSASTREARESQSTKGDHPLGLSNPVRAEVAKETGLSADQVRHAVELKSKDPVLHEKVRSGEITQREQSKLIKQNEPTKSVPVRRKSAERLIAEVKEVARQIRALPNEDQEAVIKVFVAMAESLRYTG
jgi:ParB-like chromosome segregation protein Spo0J